MGCKWERVTEEAARALGNEELVNTMLEAARAIEDRDYELGAHAGDALSIYKAEVLRRLQEGDDAKVRARVSSKMNELLARVD